MQKMEQDGKDGGVAGGEGNQQRGNEDAEVTNGEGCLAVPGVQVGGGVQRPGRDLLGLQGRMGKDKRRFGECLSIYWATYFHDLIQSLQFCGLGVQIPILQVRKLSLKVVSGLAHCTCAVEGQH